MPASSESSRVSKKLRVYVPATVPMLRELVADREIRALNDTAFAVTPALREAYASGDDEELAEVAMAEAARASLRLLAEEQAATDLGGEDADASDAAPKGPIFRRAVIAADVDDATLRPDLDDAVVRLSAAIPYDRIASIHVDLAEAESEVSKAVEVIDAADMGDADAEFVLGDAEDHQLAWYAAQELPFLLDLL
ncbi:DUF6912 family protein [Nocardia concava]|uniref:DUF6912 family protein n=1 Tax=Nocardia concava TaxID=257281 RepID=UPI000303CE17